MKYSQKNFWKNFWENLGIYMQTNNIMKKIIKLTESDLTRIVNRIIKENRETIRIPKKYLSLRNELGANPSPIDIINLFNDYIIPKDKGYVPLEVYEDGYFWNKHMDHIMVDVILDILDQEL